MAPRAKPLHIGADVFDGAFFEAGDLRLGDADLGGDLHLGPAAVETHADDVALALPEFLHRLAERDVLDPDLVGDALVLQLVDDVDRVVAVAVDRVVKRDGFNDRLHRLRDRCRILPERAGDLFDRGFTPCLPRQLLPGRKGAVGEVAGRAGDPDAVVVAQIPPDLPDDHGDGVGRELHVEVEFEVVDRLDQPDHAHLKQIVGVLVARGKTADHRQHQPEIPEDQPVARRLVARLRQSEQLAFLPVRKSCEARRIESADFDLAAVLHTVLFLSLRDKESMDGRGVF